MRLALSDTSTTLFTDTLPTVFVRFEAAHANTHGVRPGVFALANGLAKSGALSAAEYSQWRSSNDWFTASHPDPSRSDAAVYDRTMNPGAVAWFKASATPLTEHRRSDPRVKP